MKKNTLLFIGLFFIYLNSNAQLNTKNSIRKFQNETQAVVSLNKNLELPRFISFPITKPFLTTGFTIENKVNNFLSKYKSIYAIENVN